MRLLRRVANEQRAAILVVTHDTRMLTEVDRVISLRDGRVEDGHTVRGNLSRN